MAITKETIRVTDFTGGLNTFIRGDQIADTELTVALNCQRSGKGLKPRGGTVEFQTGDTPWTKRVTSIAQLNDHANGQAIFITEANQIRRYTGSATWVGVTGGLQLPDDTLWSWIQFRDTTLGGVAIGVNRGIAVGDINPVVIVDSSTNARALAGTPPAGRFIAASNQRVFIVPEDSPDQVDFCTLADVEDWTTTTAGIASGSIVIGDNVLGDITGIIAYRESLIVFFATKTYEIQFSSNSLSAVAGGDPLATNETLWQVNTLSEKVGCLSMRSVQEVMGDLVFLSSYGLMSLQALLATGDKDVSSSVLSRNVADLSGLTVNYENYCSEVIPETSKYILSVKTTGNSNNKCFVMDFLGLSTGTGPISWYEWDGNMVAECYLTAIDFNNESVLWIGSTFKSTTSLIYKYDSSELQDDGSNFVVRIRSKLFDFGVPLLRKKFYKVGASIVALDAIANLVFSYILDNQEEDRRRNFNLVFNPTVSGVDVYGIGVYGTAVYGSVLDASANFKMKVTGKQGRLARQIQLELVRETNTNFILNSFAIDLSVQSNKYITSDDTALVVS